MTIKAGRYYNLSSDDYHGDKDSISRSSLLDFKKSPHNYWMKHINPDRPIEESKATLEFGSAFHMMILEPKLFDETYIVKPGPVLLKDVGKEAYDKYKGVIEYIDKSGKKILSLKDYERLLQMLDALWSNDKAKELIEDGIYESSYFWKDEATGLMLKARPDIMHPTLYIDLKTCDDASPYSFQKSLGAFGYHIQAAMCVDAIKVIQNTEITACINICVEKKYPYSVGIYIIDEAAIDAGREEYKSLLVDLKTALDKNQFPDYEPQTIGLPKWYL